MKNHPLCLAVLTVLGLVVVVPAFAEDAAAPKPADKVAAAPADAPAAKPADQAPLDMTIKVLEVNGNKVQFRNKPEEAWQPLTVDAKLAIGCEVRTGPGSSAKIKVGPNSEIVLKRLGIINIASLLVDAGNDTVRTVIGKKYGTMESGVQHVGEVKNDFKVATPSSVLAVRGTHWRDTEYGATKETEVDFGNVHESFTDGLFASLFGGDKNNNASRRPDSFAQAATNLGKFADGSNESGDPNDNQDPNADVNGNLPGDLIGRIHDLDHFNNSVNNIRNGGTDPGGNPGGN
jgi:hypothetical protein